MSERMLYREPSTAQLTASPGRLGVGAGLHTSHDGASLALSPLSGRSSKSCSKTPPLSVRLLQLCQ